ncbi:MAG: hypothetical protein M0R77_17800 [Gammaproteobacteria bacterium]|nr:hypothetical protein [Gammaproteobacteria bacterium]
MLCDYGCEQESNFVLKNGKNCCAKSQNSCPAIRAKTGATVKHQFKSGSRKRQPYVYADLPDETKERMKWNKGKEIVPNEIVFAENSKYDNDVVKKRILQNNLLDYKCAECELTEWQGKSIVLELEHCNGVRNDHRIENLKFLCPNCHSQTETFRGRNKNTGKVIVTDEELLTALKSTANIRQALQSVGLAAKGGNYARVKALKLKFNV